MSLITYIKHRVELSDKINFKKLISKIKKLKYFEINIFHADLNCFQ